MPGFGAECMSGAHAQCSERPGECRCSCHAHTQALIRKGPNKGDPKGGIRRKIKMPKVPAVPGIIEVEAQPAETELHNSCPKCHTRAKPTDQFCRKDGTRLCLGKPCPRCEAPCEEPDAHCWQCGWRLADPLPEQPTMELLTPQSQPSRETQSGEIEVSSSPTTTAEDPIVRLRRTAREQGLLRETQVS